MLSNSVILSGAGANATTQSKDPEYAGCDHAESGRSPETTNSDVIIAKFNARKNGRHIPAAVHG
jgi:hypothetical protein